MKKSILLKVLIIFGLVLAITINYSFAASLSKSNLENSLKKIMNDKITAIGNKGTKYTGSNQNDSVTVKDSKIILKDNGTEINFTEYSIQDNICKFTTDYSDFYKYIAKQKGVSVSKLSNEDKATCALVLSLMNYDYFTRYFMATADAMNKDISLAYTYINQKASANADNYDKLYFNDSVFKWSNKTSSDGILNKSILEINLDELLKLDKSKIDSSLETYTVRVGQSKVTGLKNKTQSTKAITLQWNKSTNVNGYEVYKYDIKKKKYVKIGTTKSTTYKVTGLKAGTKYKFKVRAYQNVNGQKEYDSYSSVKELATKTNTPKIAKVKAKKTKVTVKWNKEAKASGYEVKYSANKKFKTGNITLNINKNKTTSTTIKQLQSKKKYYFKIRTYIKINGEKVYSSYSGIKSVKIK